MNILSITLLAVSVYTIPSGTTYTLQKPDPQIGTETVVNVAAGGVLDMNTLAASFAGITGAGVVSNGTATLSLAGGPYRFSGRYFGTLKFAQGETPDAEFALVVGDKWTLDQATVWEPETTVHPLKFAKNVGRFRIGAIRFATGPTLTVEDEAGLPIDLFYSDNNASRAKMKIAGSGNLYTSASSNLDPASDFLAFTGRFGIWIGRVYQNGFAFPATLKEFVIDRTLEPCALSESSPITRFQFDDSTTELTFGTDIFVRKDASVKTYPMMDLDQPIDFTGRLRIGYANIGAGANCTRLVFRKGYACLSGSSSTAPITIEMMNGAQMGSLGLDSAANSKTKVKTICLGGPDFGHAASVFHLYGGAYRAVVVQGKCATKTYCHPGSVLTVGDRYNRYGGAELHLDGCTLRLVKAGAGNSYTVLNDQTKDLNVYLGARSVRIFADMEDINPYLQSFTFPELSPIATEPGLAVDGGVDFYGSPSFCICRPLDISGPFRITDGRVAFSDTTANREASAALTGTGDIELVNGVIATYDGGKIADSSRLVYEGSAVIEVRGRGQSAARTVTVGRADAAKDTALVRRGRGVLTFGDNHQYSATYDAASVKAYVNGGLTTQPIGRIPMPVFTACFPHSNYTQVDFATIDSDNLIAPFANYTDNDFSVGEESVVRVTYSMTLEDDATVAGLNVCRADLTLADGKTLTIANGSYPGILIGNNDSGSRSVSGANATIDFGAREGIVMAGQKGYGSGPFIIRPKIAGSGGVTFAGARIGFGAGVSICNANTYTGGTWINCVIASVCNSDALSTGDVRIGNGRACGGCLDFAQAGLTVTNRVIGGGYGAPHNFNDGGSMAMMRFSKDNCTHAGPLELTDKGRVYLNIDKGTGTATLAGTVSGQRLQFWDSTGTYRLLGANVHTGGTEVVRSTVVVTNGTAFGFGDVMIDGGVVRFENSEPITVTNRIWGVGTLQLAGAAVDFTGIDNDPNIDDLTLDVAGGARRVNQIREFNAITNTSETAGSLTVTAAGVNVFTGVYDTRIPLTAEAGAVIDFNCRDMGTLSVGGAGTFRRGSMTLDGDIEPGGSGAIGTLRLDPTPTFGPNARLVTEVGPSGADKLVVADDVDVSGLPLVLKRVGKPHRVSGDILATDGALSGRFPSVQKLANGAWDLTYGAAAVRLDYSVPGIAIYLR